MSEQLTAWIRRVAALNDSDLQAIAAAGIPAPAVTVPKATQLQEQEQLKKWYRNYYSQNKEIERQRYRNYYAVNADKEKERVKKYKKPSKN